MREPGRLEPWARPGTNPDADEEADDATADAVALPGLIQSPMKTSAGAGAATKTRIDNANTKALGAGFATADLDTDANNAFAIPKLTGALVVPTLKPPVVGIVEGRKVTLQITSRGNAADTVTLTGGAGGCLWPTTGVGPFQADFDSVLAAMGNDDVILVGLQYHTTKNRWLVCALAGPYT